MPSDSGMSLTEGTGVRKNYIHLSPSGDFPFRRSMALPFPTGQVDLVRRLRSMTGAQSVGAPPGEPQPSAVRR